jgi:hypothetical protein
MCMAMPAMSPPCRTTSSPLPLLPWPPCQNAPPHHPSTAYTHRCRRRISSSPEITRPDRPRMPLASQQCTPRTSGHAPPHHLSLALAPLSTRRASQRHLRPARHARNQDPGPPPPETTTRSRERRPMTRKQCELSRRRPTAPSPPLASPGRVDHCRTLA